ncbi:MAG: lysine biosynthesis protein LysW [Promethearchaeota archaeon]
MARKCECPACYFEFDVDDDVIVGEVINCPDCGVDLEVVEINGDQVKCKEAEMSEEDWGE